MSICKKQPRRGPGLLEAIGWLAVLVIAQAVSVFCVASILVFAEFGVPSGIADIEQAALMLEGDGVPPILVGSAAVLPVVVVVPLVLLRIGADWRRTLNLRTPRIDLFLLALGGTIPISIVSAAFHSWGLQVFDGMPGNAGPFQVSALGRTIDELNGLPFLTLGSVLALAPAITEEFVFRGLIGRGLSIRYGAIAGVAITTALFAAVHLSPAYALAVVPLGLFIHFVYLATDSLKAAIGLHFANNLFAVAAIRFRLVEHLDVTLPLVWISMGAVLAVVGLLWQRRAEFSEATPLKLQSQALAGTAVGGFTVLFVTAAL